MLGLVEPGRRKLRDQQPQPLHLLRRDDTVEQLAIVGLGDLLAAGDVAQVGPRGQEERRRKLGKVRVGEVEVHVEALVLRMDSVHLCGKS